MLRLDQAKRLREQLLEIARDHEPRFAQRLELLSSTGLRRGEAPGLQSKDIDFDASRATLPHPR